MGLPLKLKKSVYIFLSLLAISVIAYTVFQFGSKSVKQEKVVVQQKPTLSPEQVVQQDMRKLEARLNMIKQKMDNLDKTSNKLGESLASLEDPEIAELNSVQAKIDTLPKSPDQKAVVLPPESSSAKVLAQPKTASGIPMHVVENYQKETGVNPAEIEALMRRTK